MMLALAWRNVWRQRRRSATTAAAVGLVVLIAILFYSMGGALTNSFYQDVTARAGHIEVHVAGYRDAIDFRARLLRPAGTLSARVAGTAPAADVVGVLDVPALLAGAARSRAVAVVGRDRSPSGAPDAAGELVAGTYPGAEDQSAIVLGRALADALKVNLGDVVSVYAPATDGLGAAAYRVRGLVRLDDPTREAATAYLPLAAAQELAAPDAVERFDIHFPAVHTLRDDPTVAAAASALRRSLGPGYEVETWRQLDPTMVALVNAMDPVLYGMSLFFYVLAGLLVMNTVYLGLIERVREFGLVVALGARGATVVRMIVTESVLLCLSGAVLGGAAGLAAVAALAPGFSIPGFEGLYAALGIAPVLYPSVSPDQVAVAVLFALATGVLAALWPALLATRIVPAEAMRHAA